MSLYKLAESRKKESVSNLLRDALIGAGLGTLGGWMLYRSGVHSNFRRAFRQSGVKVPSMWRMYFSPKYRTQVIENLEKLPSNKKNYAKMNMLMAKKRSEQYKSLPLLGGVVYGIQYSAVAREARKRKNKHREV